MKTKAAERKWKRFVDAMERFHLAVTAQKPQHPVAATKRKRAR